MNKILPLLMIIVALGCRLGDINNPTPEEVVNADIVVPVLVSPVDSSCCQTVEIFDTTPQFRWNTVDGAAGFHLQVSTKDDFSDLAVDIDTITANGEYTLPLEYGLPGDVTYYWRLRTINSLGEVSFWSNTTTFRIYGADLKYFTPSCRASKSANPVLTWESYSTLKGGVRDTVSSYNTAFELQIAYSAADLNSSSVISIPKSDDYLKSTSYELDLNSIVGDFVFWRVRALSDDGIPGKWSEAISFELVDFTPINTKTIGSGEGAIDFVYVPPGTFQMGNDPREDYDSAVNAASPIHEVTLSKGFWISKYTVTEAQWLAYIDDNETNSSNKPVITTWDEAQSFITAFNSANDSNSSLPTEAQWEWAAKGATLSKGYLYAGSSNIQEVGWMQIYPSSIPMYNGTYYLRFSGIQEVGQKLSNELGIYDMAGNTLEWCGDWYGLYTSDAQTDPTGPATGDKHVRRSYTYSDGQYAAYFPAYEITYRGIAYANFTGFRVVIPAE